MTISALTHSWAPLIAAAVAVLVAPAQAWITRRLLGRLASEADQADEVPGTVAPQSTVAKAATRLPGAGSAWRLPLGYAVVGAGLLWPVLVGAAHGLWWLAFVPVVLAGMVLAVIDWQTHRLPLVLVHGCAVATPLLLVALTLAAGEGAPWGRALAGAGLWFVVFFLPWLITAGRGMGLGDVQLAPVLGFALAWLGWGPAIVGLFAGFALGGLYVIPLVLRKAATGKTAVPYGPFLLAGAWLGLAAGSWLWEAYLDFTGLATL